MGTFNTPLWDDIERIARLGLPSIFEEVVLILNFETIVMQEDYAVTCGTTWFELAFRLYLSPGHHHVTLLLTSARLEAHPLRDICLGNERPRFADVDDGFGVAR